jgi:hydroxymethylglutaryl-CoA reductase
MGKMKIREKSGAASGSRIPGFYRRSLSERLAILRERGIIDEADSLGLLNGTNILMTEDADRIIENVIGVFGVPLGLGLNFLINGRDYVVPMAVEEPSVIAAASSAAKIVRAAGGFLAESSEPLLIGQIQVVDVENSARAKRALLENKEEILNLANDLHPKMVARGGGAKDLEIIIHPSALRRKDMIVVHLLVDTCDAMGANLVTSMCEGVSALIEKIAQGRVFMRILSNLTDRALVRASAVIPVRLLEGKSWSGERVCEGIVLASEFSTADPYRAATHNKGIMNGIDAVALATGNDWRAIEAAAHAYAARGKSYTSLSKWTRDRKGDLVGSIEIPLKVGTVGGTQQANPHVRLAHRILAVRSARELAEVMGAVGLAQNFAALRALVTEGIQRGHMSLHARSVAIAAGAGPDVFDAVVEKMVEEGNIKVWKARQILESLQVSRRNGGRFGLPERAEKQYSRGHGKVILMGEHAVVYGSHAIAGPIPLTIDAKVSDGRDGIFLTVPKWGVEQRLQGNEDRSHSIYRSLLLILQRLGLSDRDMCIEVIPTLPRAAGLGASAALAVAIIRVLSSHFSLNLSEEEVRALAHESEKNVHGRASGVDDTVSAYNDFVLFRKGTPPLVERLTIAEPLQIVIGLSGVESLTASMVAKVRKARRASRALYDRIFRDIDSLVLEAVDAVKIHDLERLGELMNVNQGLLNALQVSSAEIEMLVEIARKNGALGAKLTGGGGGGAVIALCPNKPERVEDAIRRAGYRAFTVQLGKSGGRRQEQSPPAHEEETFRRWERKEKSIMRS